MKHPLVVTASLLAVAVVSADAADGRRKPRDPAAVERLKSETGAAVEIGDATGGARFVRAPRGKALGGQRALTPTAKMDETMAFLDRHGRAFGLSSPRTELKFERRGADRGGRTHLAYSQEHLGVPVFGASLRAHFDADGNLASVNGTVLPDIDVSVVPSRSADDAGAAALKFLGAASDVSVRSSRLMVFREGLAKGVPGADHLAYEIEAGNGKDARDFVYVDAHTGKVIDRISGIHDALFRRAYDGQSLPTVPPTYPDSPFWVEGDPFPTSSAEADNMILASKDTYDLFHNAFGRDSFDAAGAVMDSIFNRGYSCPNASWNGVFISFCPGLTTDDVTGHEWGHAYTQYTHNLIYQWQPGALNESYSDIFGEVVDRINGRGGDTPDNPRTADSCSVYGGTPPPVLTITGGSAAGSYFARASVNEPPPPFTVGPTEMAIAATAAPAQPTGACGTVTGVSGKIAIVDWTLTATGANECGSGARATNAFNAGATGIIFVAPAAGLLNLGSIAAIASVEVTYADGAAIKAGLPANATITMNVGTDDSVRWLMGEDDTAVGLSGPLRDMWNPRCYGNPGKVTDTFEYVCSTADGGGVHTNSGIPNHAFALTVDGGTYNGQTIAGIGLTKAAHIYFRAMDVYQHSASDFADHADALEQSCADLTGENLPDLSTGAPSGEVIGASDCAQLSAAIAAVELRTPPAFCGFQTLLAQNPPPLCDSGSVKELFSETFEKGKASTRRWSVSHSGITADFTPRDWKIVPNLPDDRSGRAVFGSDPDIGTCGPGGDETAVLHLVSKKIEVPSSVTETKLTFKHWVATEGGWDGGNLKISVDDGPWQLVQPADFVYNAYNTTLFTAAQGNTNPIAGEPAFSGTDGGAVDGSWGRSIVNLAPYAAPGSKIRLRFDIGNDGCTGRFGWYVDDVTVYTCRNKHKR